MKIQIKLSPKIKTKNASKYLTEEQTQKLDNLTDVQLDDIVEKQG